MIIVICRDCQVAFRIIGDLDASRALVGPTSDFWPNRFPCPLCRKSIIGAFEYEVSPALLAVLTLRELTPQEAFLAFNEMGLPEERDCKKSQIEELFTTPIRGISGKETITGRFILEHIEFWDGSKIYLGAAPGGAIIYKISSPPNYTRDL